MKPIYIAIDTPDLDRAKHLAKAVAPLAGGLKLGLEFFCHNGRTGVPTPSPRQFRRCRR